MKEPVSSKLRNRLYRKSLRDGTAKDESPKDGSPKDSAPRDGAALGDRTSGDAVRVDPAVLNPAAGKTKKAKRRYYIRQYIAWLWPYRFAIATVFFLALLTATSDLVWPLVIKYMIDGILPDRTLTEAQKFAKLNQYGLGVMCLLVVKQLIESTRSYRTALLNVRVLFRLRRRLYHRLLRLPLSGLADMKTGGIVSRLSGDVDSVTGLVQMALISPGVAIIRVVLTVVILFALSWRLAIAALIMMPPLAMASLFWSRRVRPIYRSMREDRSAIDGRVTETFGGVRVVRAFRREPREEQGYAVGHHSIIRKSLFAERMEMVLEAAWGILIPTTSLAIVWYGGRLFLRGAGGIGDIFAFQVYAMLLLQPIWQIVSSVSQTQKSLAAMERVFEVLEMAADKPDEPGAVDADRFVREIRFNHVSFEYRAGAPVLRDIHLTIPGGATVALVGPSGAGKTTLTDLVARFHDPTSGSITLNGTDLRRLRLRSYRSLLAVVQQETFLFDGTVRENISYGRRGASDADVIDAARRANAHGFIEQLPEGYETLIGERGFKLSGGQKQRISIARAVLADPQILILDEATSNLDTESEQLIQSALADLLKSRTTFVIAHRLSTITSADLIVVLDEGSVRELGNHEQLMQGQGLYFEMVQRQRQSFGNLAEAVEV